VPHKPLSVSIADLWVAVWQRPWDKVAWRPIFATTSAFGLTIVILSCSSRGND
jgi:hypothetical protein